MSIKSRPEDHVRQLACCAQLNEGNVLRITRPTAGRTRLFISLHRRGSVPITEAARQPKGCHVSRVRQNLLKKRKVRNSQTHVP